MRAAAPHAAAAEEVARQLASDPRLGLTDAEAAEHLARFGPNRVTRPRRPAYSSIALRQLTDPLVGLLLAAAAISFLIEQDIEAGAIPAIVALNAVLAFLQEAGAERAVLALHEADTRLARVVRGGALRLTPAEELVPGNLVLLEAADRVPADARVLAAADLAVDESSLTAANGGPSRRRPRSLSPLSGRRMGSVRRGRHPRRRGCAWSLLARTDGWGRGGAHHGVRDGRPV